MNNIQLCVGVSGRSARTCYCPLTSETRCAELRSLTREELNDRGATAQTEARRPRRLTHPNSALWRVILLSSYCLHSLCQRRMPVNIKLSASLLQYETQVSLCNLCLSSPIPPSPPECNKCPAIIYFNSLPSCTDEMDS